jgi:hypothetical protein
MQALCKVSVWLLLAAVTAAPLAAQGLNTDFAPNQRLGACHQHSAPVPQPGPTSHSCCQRVHYPAIVLQGSTVRPDFRVLVEFVFEPDSVSLGLATSSNLPIIYGDPPITPRLRV